MIRVILPLHLRTLASIPGDVGIDLAGPVTLAAVLDALEERYPELRGTIRDRQTLQRRSFIRFFAEGRDLSHEPADAQLPESVATGKEPIRIVGALAGG